MKLNKLKTFQILLLAIVSALFLSFCEWNEVSLENKLDKPSPQTTWTTDLFRKNNSLPIHQQEALFEKEMQLIKNKDKLLPLGNLSEKIVVLSIGGNPDAFHTTLAMFTDINSIYVPTIDALNLSQQELIKKADVFILSIHSAVKDQTLSNIPEFQNVLTNEKSKNILVVFGNSSVLEKNTFDSFNSVVFAHENHHIAQSSTAQAIFGAIPIKAKQSNHFSTESNGRLEFSTPSELGIDSLYINKINEMAKEGIRLGAYPGCQILVAVDNKIILNKSYGHHTYDKSSKLVENDDLYDIASITKIAASTLLTMQLHSEGKFDLNKRLGDYLDETKNTPYENVNIREMMAHQAGFTPYIPFYTKTKINGQLSPTIYSNTKKEDYTLAVAENIFMKNNYVDSMYSQIYKTPRSEKGFKYSDLCFYFTKKIVEQLIGESQHTYLLKNIYQPMGLKTLTYLPLESFSKHRITPTEKDTYFRNQLVHGYVHDQGAAMLGGVAGHAGLFSNAYDLANIMQLFLRKGNYGGKQYFSSATMDEYNKAQFPGNRRGAGFDRPKLNGGGTCDELASQQSFGHSGFTGTLAWADPKDNVIFIFLSNRVNPSAENWKIRDLNIRTNIQHIVYEAVNNRKKND